MKNKDVENSRQRRRPDVLKPQGHIDEIQAFGGKSKAIISFKEKKKIKDVSGGIKGRKGRPNEWERSYPEWSDFRPRMAYLENMFYCDLTVQIGEDRKK